MHAQYDDNTNTVDVYDGNGNLIMIPHHEVEDTIGRIRLAALRGPEEAFIDRLRKILTSA